MTAQPDIEKLIQQTRQYEFSDGLRDLQMAIFFALSSLAVWLSFEPRWLNFVGALVKTFGRWAVWFSMTPTVLSVAAVWGMLGLMKVIRQRWLWRESGMVQSVRWAVPRRVNVLSTVILVGGLAAGLGLRFLGWVDEAFILHMLWASTGWSYGYTLIGVGRHIGLTRYIWLGAVGGAASTVVLFLPFTFSQVALIYGLGWCCLLVASGSLALRQALRPS
jgi:hypothetical protein